MIGRVIYYFVAVILAVLLSFLTIGSSVHTTHYLDDRAIDMTNESVDFLAENLLAIDTITVVDCNDLMNVFVRTEIGFFPSFSISGDVGTPSTIHDVIFALNIAVFILLFWFVSFFYRRTRARKTSDGRSSGTA